jgi:regulation of enolase protein 1 (concanavalin A-like superfamily)
MCGNTLVKLLFVVLVCSTCLPTSASTSQWGLYPIEENDFKDSSGHHRDGTALYEAVTTFDPQRGWVADFTQNAEGSPQVQLPPTGDPANTGELTISAWVKWFGPDGRWQGIAGKSFNSSNRGWVLQLQNTDGDVCWPDGPTGVVLDEDCWLHLVVTFAQGISRVYVDGRVESEASDVSLPQVGNWDAAHVTLGHAEDRTNASLWFNGYLDDIYLFSRALTKGEVKGLFDGIVPSFLKARNPTPAEGAAGVAMPALLRWTPGDTASSQRFYAGTDCELTQANFVAVLDASMIAYLYNPLTPASGTFCWRIDTVDAAGAVHVGDTWCFSTEPSRASERGVVNPCCDPVLTWPPVPDAVMYHVYFATTEMGLDSPAADKGTTTRTSIALGALQGGTTYYWRVDVIAADGTVYAGEVWSFTSPMCETGGVVREWWLDLPGTTIADLRNSPRFPSVPDGRECLPCFEGPTDWKDNYGTRLYGWLLPPTSGAYTFCISGDDNQMLFLSPDENPANAVLIARVDNWTSPRQWNKETNQESGPIFLMAGQRYYIEALGKEGTGGDNIAVSWRRPGMIDLEIICVPFVENPICASTIAYAPAPADGATEVATTTNLSWEAGHNALQHDVYFGDDCDLVATATPVRCGPYRGRQSATTYDPGVLTPGKTYYWRIDEVNPLYAASPWKGCVWTFTTGDCSLSIDDFESYASSAELQQTWEGTPFPVGIEQTVVHGDQQSMRLDYAYIPIPGSSGSEATRTESVPVSWPVAGATTLSLWIHGQPPKFIETSPGCYLMSGSGTDIWGTADEFRLAYKRLAGDGTITVRVQEIGNTDSWAKAGVMIRETLDPGSPHAMVVVTPSQGVSFQRRRMMWGASEDTTVPGVTAPYWVRLTRIGNVFTAEHSYDGSTWTSFAGGDSVVTIPMPANVYIGLAVTSHNPNALTTARFSKVAMGGAISGTWNVADVGVDQPGNDPAPLYVRVKDSSGHIAVSTHAGNPYAVIIDAWRRWQIPLTDFAGVNPAHIRELTLGVGEPIAPRLHGVSQIYIDDICLR